LSYDFKRRAALLFRSSVKTLRSAHLRAADLQCSVIKTKSNRIIGAVANPREKAMSKKAAENHKKASEHHKHAAHHHAQAAKHHDAGHHEKAAHYAHTAMAHAIHARGYAEEAVKAHAEEYDEEYIE
jgi:hypothetical protein